MKSINLERVIKDYNLETAGLANELFPGIKYPQLALKRVMAGKTLLDSQQLLKLSSITGIPIQEMYEYEGGWKSGSNPHNIELKNGDFKALLNTTTWVSIVYKNGTLAHEEILASKATTLSEYVESLNKLIKTL